MKKLNLILGLLLVPGICSIAQASDSLDTTASIGQESELEATTDFEAQSSDPLIDDMRRHMDLDSLYATKENFEEIIEEIGEFLDDIEKIRTYVKGDAWKQLSSENKRQYLRDNMDQPYWMFVRDEYTLCLTELNQCLGSAEGTAMVNEYEALYADIRSKSCARKPVASLDNVFTHELYRLLDRDLATLEHPELALDELMVSLEELRDTVFVNILQAIDSVIDERRAEPVSDPLIDGMRESMDRNSLYDQKENLEEVNEEIDDFLKKIEAVETYVKSDAWKRLSRGEKYEWLRENLESPDSMICRKEYSLCLYELLENLKSAEAKHYLDSKRSMYIALITDVLDSATVAGKLNGIFEKPLGRLSRDELAMLEDPERGLDMVREALEKIKNEILGEPHQAINTVLG